MADSVYAGGRSPESLAMPEQSGALRAARAKTDGDRPRRPARSSRRGDSEEFSNLRIGLR